MRTSEKERGKREKCKKERRERGKGKKEEGKRGRGVKEKERERTEEIQRFGNGTDSFLKKTDDSGCNAMEYGQ